MVEASQSNSIKRFLLEVAVFVVLQLLLLGGYLSRTYDPSREFPTYAPTRLKHERLAAAPPPRMILVGGSNLVFGVVSETIAEQTPYHPVNMGLVGGLRLQFMLDEVRDAAGPGDLVVLALEYHQLANPAGAAEPQVLMRVIEQRPANLVYMSWPHWRRILDDGALQHLGVMLRRSFRTTSDEEWEHMTFNEFGDRTDHRRGDGKVFAAVRQTIPRVLSEPVVRDNIEAINDFARHCAARGARVVYTFPPVPSNQYEADSAVLARLLELLNEGLEIPILGSPEAMVFPRDDFLHESYHLKGDPSRVRTERLLALLRPILQQGEAP